MDERGIDHVSLNEINRASGHRNRSAISYPFGSRDAIVRELVTRTIVTVNAERHALLDHLETTTGSLSMRAAMEILIGPMSRQLRTPNGRRYLRLLGQLVNHPRYVSDAQDALLVSSSVARCVQHLAPAFRELPGEVAAERRSQIAGFVIRAFADQARLLDTDQQPRTPLSPDGFSANLVDVSLAMLTAPSSVPA